MKVYGKVEVQLHSFLSAY